jgi:hypothetical protein
MYKRVNKHIRIHQSLYIKYRPEPFAILGGVAEGGGAESDPDGPNLSIRKNPPAFGGKPENGKAKKRYNNNRFKARNPLTVKI